MKIEREAVSGRGLRNGARAARLRAGLGIPLLVLMSAPAVLRASGDSDALRSLAEQGPLLTVVAESSAGTARLDLRPSDYTIEHGVLRWSSSAPAALRDPASGREIARLKQVSVTYVADPAIAIGVSVLAGPQPTNITVTSAALSFPDLANARGRASAGFTVTDLTGDSVQTTGLNPDGQAFQAFYNDPAGAATGSTFATLVSGLSAATPYSSNAIAEDFPVAPGLSTAAEGGAVLGTLTSMSTQLRLSLSANDSFSSSSVFVIEPLNPQAAITLGAKGAAGSATFALPLSELRSEAGARVWRSVEPALLIDPATGVEIARLEAGSTAVVADRTMQVEFSLANLTGVPQIFSITVGAPAFPAVVNAFGRVSTGLSVTDSGGDGVSLVGVGGDNQAFQTYYNDIGNVPGTGPTLATLIDGLSTPTPYSTAVTMAELAAGGAFSAVAEGGATLGDVTSLSLRWNFELGASDTATATTIVALQGGGTVSGRVYHDIDGNGAQDPGEPGLAGVDVDITDSQTSVWTVTTDGNGDYGRAVPSGSTSIDVDETTLPAGATQTEGTDPTVVQVPVGGNASDVDGYQIQSTSVLEIPALDALGLAALALGLGVTGALLLLRRRARNGATGS